MISTIKKQIYAVNFFSILSILIMGSCERDKIDNSNSNNQIENIKIIDGVVEIENSSDLKSLAKSYQENVSNQDKINDKIKEFQEEGFIIL
jgi:hypothetical protein